MFASEQIVHKNFHTEEQSKKECSPRLLTKITHDATKITHDITKITHDITKITHGVALKFSREFLCNAVKYFYQIKVWETKP